MAAYFIIWYTFSSNHSVHKLNIVVKIGNNGDQQFH